MRCLHVLQYIWDMTYPFDENANDVLNVDSEYTAMNKKEHET